MLTDLSSAPLERGTVAPASDDLDTRILVGMVERLSQRFPHIHQMEILTALTDCLAETSDAKVQSFRAILAERAARRRLVAAGAVEGSMATVPPGGDDG